MTALRAFHVAAALLVAAAFAGGQLRPALYTRLMQEDGVVEWTTVWLFLAAGSIGVVHAVRKRKVFDGLVALFCLFVAGEEFSWGQRLIGYYPAEFFLQHNFQQEANLHNLPQTFVQPKYVLMTALAGYGVALPVMALLPTWSSRMSRAGATAPPRYLVPWFVIAIALLAWYPLPFTGEWVEALAGGLFLMASGASLSTLTVMTPLAIALGVATTFGARQLESARDVTRLACATGEVRSLLADISEGSAASDSLWRMRRVHKRVWTSINEGYIHDQGLQLFKARRCATDSNSGSVRRQYGIDPWGSPYWLEVERRKTQTDVVVYSFGPNRRRDGAGDDIRMSTARRMVRD